ncbi:putative Ig domain-containing protein [Leptospira sp. GIMC2001]|uniref:putative Ig domain-containing protein n=1 Tax=Leptospira sp. GIMC2001 TaxID=1513297 RepID=UPI00234A66A2|nr:putative Ig domain-containing protein [Leptospira sp. GIMC2001]WCL48910.1 hypothetical protein O4O04_16675 [Leptospira sp. GIMC2001]
MKISRIALIFFILGFTQCNIPSLNKSELQGLTEIQTLLRLIDSLNNDSNIPNSNLAISYAESSYSFLTGEEISEIVPETQGSPTEFSISPQLVSGLNFDSATGAISGTPNKVITNQIYTITASKLSETQSATISITTRIPSACSDTTIVLGSGTSIDPFQICSPDQLQSLTAHHIANPNSFYELQQDLDLSSIANFDPIGTSVNPFNGVFNGNYHTIFNLKIDYPAISSVGLFGETSGGLTTIIQNLRLRNAWVRGLSRVGNLIGNSAANQVENIISYDGYSRSESDAAGGLIGRNSGVAVIYNSGFTGTVEVVTNYAGGILGYAFGSDQMKKCFANATVSGGDYIGGLIGRQVSIFIEDSYAQGSVTGATYVGGLSGRSSFGAASITNSYSAVVVSPGVIQGGLVSEISAAVNNSYYDSDITTQADNDTRGQPRTTNQLKCPTEPNDSCAGIVIFDTWDPTIWNFGDGTTYPSLQWEKDF